MTVYGAPGGIGARYQGLGRGAAGIDASAADEMALNDSHLHPGAGQAECQDGPAWPVPMMIASKSGMTSLSSVNEFNQTGSGRGEIVRRTHDAHAAPGVEHEQVIVTADDRLGSGRECELEILIVLWITAIA